MTKTNAERQKEYRERQKNKITNDNTEKKEITVKDKIVEIEKIEEIEENEEENYSENDEDIEKEINDEIDKRVQEKIDFFFAEKKKKMKMKNTNLVKPLNQSPGMVTQVLMGTATTLATGLLPMIIVRLLKQYSGAISSPPLENSHSSQEQNITYVQPQQVYGDFIP